MPDMLTGLDVCIRTSRATPFLSWDPHVRLDYVFVPNEFCGQTKSCEVDRESPQVLNASDHLPLLAQMEISYGE